MKRQEVTEGVKLPNKRERISRWFRAIWPAKYIQVLLYRLYMILIDIAVILAASLSQQFLATLLWASAFEESM